jgi:ER lumen protein retaining receptor
MYLIVFCVRYLDLFMYYISLYNTFMKIFFIGSTAFIIYLMRYKKPYCSVSDVSSTPTWYNDLNPSSNNS